MRTVDRTALISGLLFILLGVLFVFEQAGVLTVRGDVVVPLALVGLGVGLLVGNDERRGPRDADPPDPSVQI